MFADDVALATHTEKALQRIIDLFAQVCREFGLIISLKKTNVMGQGAACIKTGDYTLKVVDQFFYLGSTISGNLSIDTEPEQAHRKGFGYHGQTVQESLGRQEH